MVLGGLRSGIDGSTQIAAIEGKARASLCTEGYPNTTRSEDLAPTRRTSGSVAVPSYGIYRGQQSPTKIAAEASAPRAKFGKGRKRPPTEERSSFHSPRDSRELSTRSREAIRKSEDAKKEQKKIKKQNTEKKEN